MPEILRDLNLSAIPDWGWLVLLLAGSILAGTVLAALFVHLALKIVHRTTRKLDNIIIQNLRVPAYFLFPTGVAYAIIRIFNLQFTETGAVSAAAKILAIVFLAWLAMRIVNIAAALIARKFDIHRKDNLRARGVLTQIMVAKRIAKFVIVILSLISVFFMFEELRGLGLSLLASAGVAGLIVGFAAQKALGNLLAGIQIAITQPIRIDDVVIVEGEWGWIEEITLTYVVVRIWDLRRLVLPISYFLEKPFQNWTRTSADILGTVFLYTDYTVPVDAIREKVTELLQTAEGWDGKVNGVQVTDCKPDVMEIRVLVSAPDSSIAWNLRCYLREKLIDFIQAEYPSALPRTRAQLEQGT